MTPSDCRSILEAASGNIYRIKEIFDRTSPSDEVEISPVSEFILRVLLVMSQAVPLSDIRILARDSAFVHIESDAHLSNALLELCSKGITTTVRLAGGDRLVSLVSASSPFVQRIQKEALRLLPLTNEPLRLLPRGLGGAVSATLPKLFGLFALSPL